MGLSMVADIRLAATLTKPAVLTTNIPTDALNFTKRVELVTGTGAGQADKLYYAERTLTASSNEDLDLTGVLVDNFSATFTAARVKALAVLAAPSDPNATKNTNTVVLGAAASNQWATLLNTTGTLTLKPGGLIIAVADVADAVGWPITAATGDLFRVTNGGAGTSVTYQIVVVASSV